MIHRSIPLTALVLSALLAGCTVFRLPTVQGNVIEQKQVDQLQTGMTEEQVRQVLGGPLLQDTFDPNHWDYVYYFRDSKKHVSKRILNLYFSEGKLARIVGKELPAGQTDLSTEALGKAQGTPNAKSADTGSPKKSP